VTARLALFLALFCAFSVGWGRLLWYLDERSNIVRSLTFAIMTRSTRTAPEIKSALLTCAYLACGAIGIVGFSIGFGLDPRAILRTPAQAGLLITLGIFAELSLSSLFMSLLFAVTGLRVNPAEAIGEIPWIAGINQLPPMIRPLAPAFSGFVEETFFRGAALLILTTRFDVHPVLAILLVTLVFTVEQLLQTRTAVQAAMIGAGCLSISFVGGLLVVITQSGLAASLVHASFVAFYFRPMGRSPQALRA